MNVTREHIEAAHKRLFELAGEIVATGDEHASMLFGLELKPFKEGGAEMGLAPGMLMPFPLDEVTKRMVAPVMQKMLERYPVAVHIAESWMVVVDAKDADKDDPLGGRAVSECEDRTEAVTMIFIGEGWRAFAAHTIAVAGDSRTLLDAKLQFEDEKNYFEGMLIGGKRERVQ